MVGNGMFNEEEIKNIKILLNNNMELFTTSIEPKFKDLVGHMIEHSNTEEKFVLSLLLKLHPSNAVPSNAVPSNAVHDFTTWLNEKQWISLWRAMDNSGLKNVRKMIWPPESFPSYKPEIMDRDIENLSQTELVELAKSIVEEYNELDKKYEKMKESKAKFMDLSNKQTLALADATSAMFKFQGTFKEQLEINKKLKEESARIMKTMVALTEILKKSNLYEKHKKIIDDALTIMNDICDK